MKQFLKVFTKDDEDWKAAFEALLQRATAKRQGCQDRAEWGVEDILLSECPKLIPGAQTTTGLLTVWNEAKKHLHLSTERISMTGEAPATLYLELAGKNKSLPPDRLKLMKRILRKERVSNMGQWKDWAWEKYKHRPLTEQLHLLVEHGVELEVESRDTSQLGWNWKVGKKAEYRTLFGEDGGHANNQRSLLGEIDAAFVENSPVRYLPFVAILQRIWNDRNETTYTGRRNRTPVFVPIKQAIFMATSISKGLPEENRKHRSYQCSHACYHTSWWHST
ncbi:hypothetical protein R1sor_025920 [Riccia sorocarpa]|uniref:Uncharacterized protein n=1 Tax=Riccia sorocarpa TaxID=122646 RepID=A0ABD3GBL0_9MARC